MQVLNKDILTIKRGIIVHQVNCKKVMGKGLAREIRREYPQHYFDYLKKEPQLGDIIVTKINPQLFIVGIYGQDNYGYGGCFTNYDAFQKGFLRIRELAEKEKLSIYVPYKIGCGLAGGDWLIIKNILEQVPDCYCCKVNK